MNSSRRKKKLLGREVKKNQEDFIYFLETASHALLFKTFNFYWKYQYNEIRGFFSLNSKNLRSL